MQTEATQRLTVARDTLIVRNRRQAEPVDGDERASLRRTHQRRQALQPREVCGSTPAMMLTFQQQIGMLFRRKTMTLKARLCRDCGLTIGRQNKTLTTGWWGIISFFKNIGFIASNAGALSTASHLPAPQPPPNPEDFKQRGPLTPGRSVMLRPGVLVSIAAVAFTVFAVASWIPREHALLVELEGQRVRRAEPEQSDTGASDPRARKRTSASSRPWSSTVHSARPTKHGRPARRQGLLHQPGLSDHAAGHGGGVGRCARIARAPCHLSRNGAG